MSQANAISEFMNTLDGKNTTGNSNSGQAKNTEEVKIISQKIESIIHCFQLIEEENDAIKEILSDLKSNHGLKKTVARKVAKIFHKNNRQEVEEEEQQAYELLEKLSKILNR